MTLYKWSQTAATNATADATINWAEGQAPSSVNDSARALMAAAAKYRDDTAGALLTTNTSTAYNLTSNQVFASLSAMSGQSLRVKIHTTNGASPTLNVDGLGAKSIVTATGTAVPSGALVTSNIYDLVYANGSSEWILIGGSIFTPPFASGTLMLFQQTAAPTGWTKQSTHNDKALRVVTGTASSGGTNAFSTVQAQTATGSYTLATADIPAHSHSVTDPGHPHDVKFNVGNTFAVTGGSTAVTTITAAGGQTGSQAGISNTTSITIANAGGGGSHSHTLTMDIQFVDLIIASKD